MVHLMERLEESVRKVALALPFHTHAAATTFNLATFIIDDERSLALTHFLQVKHLTHDWLEDVTHFVRMKK